MDKTIKSLALSVALVALLGGCAVGTPYQRPEVALPAGWDQVPTPTSAAAPAHPQAVVTADWWRQFGSAELDRFMEQVLLANHDLGAALARIEQARAAAGIVAANRYPSIGVAANTTRSHDSRDGAGSGGESTQLSANVSYELDLWGARQAQREAAAARLDSSIFDRDAVALVLQADVAANYFQALALKDRLAIARKNLEAARQVLSLVQTRYDKGANTGLEVAQQTTSVLNIEAQIPQLEQDLQATQSALAILLGQAPQGFAVQGGTLAGLAIPAVAAFQPPQLLERRPDIQRSEAQLMAAHADIGAARAALYPNVRLGASTVAGGVFSSGSSLVTSLIASLTQTLFDGGQLQGQVRQSEARKAELVQQYLQSVLASMKEVQDNLAAVAASQSRQGLLDQAALQAQEAYRIASVRYTAGSQDLLTLLDSQRIQLQAEDSRIQAGLARLTATVGLYKALGGGWESGKDGQS